jgi:diguanylate cyclase (GGDEF)-like protein
MSAFHLPRAVGGGLRRAVRSVRGLPLWALDAPLRSYTVIVTAAAVGVCTFAIVRSQWRSEDLLIFAGLIACGFVAIESTRTVREVHGTVGRDLQTVWYLTAAIVLSPVYALLAPMIFTGYKLWRVPRGFVYRRIFSNATISLAYGLASLLFHSFYHSASGSSSGTGVHALKWTVLVAICGALAWLINNGLILVAIKVSDRKSRIRDMFGNIQAITSDLIELSLAVSLSLVVSIDPWLMVLALPSVVLYRRYLIHAQLVAEARLDAKTGLLNAGTWHHEAEVELFRALRTRKPLALAMVDIDHFKDVNSMAGQMVRDQLIRDIAGMLRDQLPGQDLIGRFGTEEFAILLPQTGRDEAQRITERLRDYIAAEPIAIESGSQEGFVFRLTVSIGVAVMNESRRALAELIGAADSALVRAKSTGWSKVYVLPDGSDDAEIA